MEMILIFCSEQENPDNATNADTALAAIAAAKHVALLIRDPYLREFISRPRAQGTDWAWFCSSRRSTRRHGTDWL